MLTGRLEALRLTLSQVDDRVAAVKSNAAEIEEAIYRMLQEALYTLSTLSDYKISVLGAVQVELQRQVDHIGWMENFLKYQKEVLAPLDFLQAWERHMTLRAEVHNGLNVASTVDVEPDIEVPASSQCCLVSVFVCVWVCLCVFHAVCSPWVVAAMCCGYRWRGG